MAATSTVRVALGDRGYDVVIAGTLEGLGAAVWAVGGRRALLVTDDVVDPLWGHAARDSLGSAGIEVVTIVIPSGEANKNLETWWSIVDAALRQGVDRGTFLVALGGGVVGDLTGFAAASVLRGVPFVQVPTTLLSMVDSSVGGKTGFDHPLGKNLVGAFWQPSLVWAAIETLATLPGTELRSGLGEVVKTALLADPALFERLESEGSACVTEPASLADVVRRCVVAKAAVVAADERESGARACLNAGHTVGHAIEQVAGFGVVAHGEAVGMGLVAELTWASREGWVASELVQRVRAVLERLGLRSSAPDLDAGALVTAMRLDKKGRGDTMVLPVVTSPGVWRLVPLPMSRLSELLNP